MSMINITPGPVSREPKGGDSLDRRRAEKNEATKQAEVNSTAANTADAAAARKLADLGHKRVAQNLDLQRKDAATHEPPKAGPKPANEHGPEHHASKLPGDRTGADKPSEKAPLASKNEAAPTDKSATAEALKKTTDPQRGQEASSHERGQEGGHDTRQASAAKADDTKGEFSKLANEQGQEPKPQKTLAAQAPSKPSNQSSTPPQAEPQVPSQEPMPAEQQLAEGDVEQLLPDQSLSEPAPLEEAPAPEEMAELPQESKPDQKNLKNQLPPDSTSFLEKTLAPREEPPSTGNNNPVNVRAGRRGLTQAGEGVSIKHAEGPMSDGDLNAVQMGLGAQATLGQMSKGRSEPKMAGQVHAQAATSFLQGERGSGKLGGGTKNAGLKPLVRQSGRESARSDGSVPMYALMGPLRGLRP